MKNLILVPLFFLITSTAAFAVPYLQLDVSEKTITSTANSFELYALLRPKNKDPFPPPDQFFYISAALITTAHEGVSSLKDIDAGSFKFKDVEYSFVPDNVALKYGTRPVETDGTFDTYYFEFEFNFVEENYDDSLYYAEFAVNVSKLNRDYGLHFDLYTLDIEGDIDKLASSSYDAFPNPEPTTAILLGFGLLAIAKFARKKIV